MSDERRYRGLWWIPAPGDDDSDVEKVGGVLTIDAAGRVHLEVMSALVDGHLQGDGSVRRRSSRGFDEPRIIHGEAEGEAVTLLYCTRANGGVIQVGTVFTETQVFRAGAAVVGAWLDTADDAVFVGMRVEMSHLTEWSGRSGLSHGINGPHPVDGDESAAATGHTMTVTLETVPSDRVELPSEDITAILLWSQSFGRGGTDNAWGRTHQIKERTFYEVQTPQPRGALEFQDAIRPVQNLLTLATQSPCAVGSHHLIVADDAESGRPRVELFFHGENVEIKGSRERHHLLFTLDDLGGVQALDRWYALSRKIGPPVNVLFGLDYEHHGYYETRLFTAATVVEGFHATLCPTSTAIPPEDHKTIRNLIKTALKGVDQRLREWALNAVGHNRSGLTKRCLELTELADPTAVDMLLGDRKVWAKWLVRARNSVGHDHLTPPRDDETPEEAYYRLLDITRHLLHLILMSQLGLDATLQQRAVTEHWGYQARLFRQLVTEYNSRRASTST